MMWYDGIFGQIDMSLGGKDRTWKRLAKYKNRQAWQNFFAILVSKALDRYSFDGLPETVSERVLKLSLLYYASVCFFEYKGSIMALPGASGTSGVTVYGDYTDCWVYGRNGFNKQIRLWLPGEEELPFLAQAYMSVPEEKRKARGVWFRENEQKFPFLNLSIMFADELADSWRKVSIARKNAAVPYIIKTKQSLLETVRRMLTNRDNNEEAIVLSTGGLSLDDIDIMPINVTAEAIKIHTDLVEWYYSQYDALCGLNSNANPDKAERLLVDEVNANNESTSCYIDSTVAYIQQGLDEVNKRFGTHITVKRNGKGAEENDDVRRMDADSGSGELRDGSGDGVGTD